jgi:hypothetical protein
MMFSSVAWSVVLLLTHAEGWAPVQRVVSSRWTLASMSNDVLGGVAEFDQWFKNVDKADCQSSIQHHAFGSLRGLKCQESTDGSASITVPKDVVLSSSYADEDWDSQLAVKLWNECKRGRQSDVYG